MKRPLLFIGSVVLGAGLVAGGFALDARHEDQGDGEKLPGPETAAQGIKVEGDAIPDGRAFEAFVRDKERAILDRKVELTVKGKSLGTFSLRELGATVDVDFTLSRIRPIAHRGTDAQRQAEARAARDGKYDVPLPVTLGPDKLADKLGLAKEEMDLAPRPARRKVDRGAHTDTVSNHEDGVYLDIFAATERVLVAALHQEAKVEIAPYRWVPAATKNAVAAADASTIISSFETRYGGTPGRNKNILRAAAQLDGLVLMPNETVSYNDTVGPRSTENGFFSAPEIYKGEIREGIGGGACQVAGTLYAAAFFGGFEILERHNHSRPSAYIRPGMDATVSYPILDLRIKNPFDFPVVVSARADGVILRFELLGKERRVDVALATETLGVLKFSRKIEKTAYVPAGEFKVKQKGRTGLTIKKIKTTKDLRSGESHLEESTDLYPSTQEIFLVGPGFKEEDLPPLEPPTGGA